MTEAAQRIQEYQGELRLPFPAAAPWSAFGSARLPNHHPFTA